MKKTIRKALLILFVILTCAGIGAGLVTLTLRNPHFAPTAVGRLMAQGGTYLDDGNYAEAIERYRLVLFRDPGNAEACLRLTDAFVLSYDPTGAIPYLRQGLRVQEDARLRDAYEKLLVVAQAGR